VAEELYSHLKTIWVILREELMSPIDSEVQRACLDSLARLTKTFSFNLVHSYTDSGDDDGDNKDSPSRSRSALQQFLNPILDDCTRQLASPDISLVVRNGLVLATCAEASPESCVIVLQSSLPIAVQCLLVCEKPDEKLQLVRLLTKLLHSCQKSHQSSANPTQCVPQLRSILRAQSQVLFEFYSETIQSEVSPSVSAELKLASVAGLHALSSMKEVLSNEDEANSVLMLTKVFLTAPQSSSSSSPVVNRDLQRRAMTALHQYFLTTQKELICAKTIPELISAVKGLLVHHQGASSGLDRSAVGEVEHVMQGLKHLAGSGDHGVFNLVVRFWLSILETSRELVDPQVFKIVLQQFHQLFEHLESQSQSQSRPSTDIHEESEVDSRVELCHKEVIPLLFQLSVSFVSQSPDSSFLDLLQFINLLIQDLVLFLPNNERENVVENYVKKFMNDEVNLKQTSESIRLVQMLESFLIPLKEENLSKVFSYQEESSSDDGQKINLGGFLTWLVQWRWEISHSVIQSVGIIAGSLVNKIPVEPKEFFELILSESERLELDWNDENLTSQRVCFLVWVSKFLVVRSHLVGWKIVHRFCSCLANPSCGQNLSTQIIDGFKLILNESTVPARFHFTIKKLYKQRFYYKTKKLLINQENPHQTKPSALMVLSSVLSTLPSSIVVSELPSIFPAIHQSLNSENVELIKTSLESIDTLCTTAPKTITDHLDSLIKILLRLASTSPSQIVRVHSLQVLEKFLGFSYHLLFPHQKEVVSKLAVCLDDKKRPVRRAAVRCRNEWIMLQNE